MKCKVCPLCVDDGTFEICGDCDLLCLANTVNQSFPDRPEHFDTDVNGCTRPNKWILAQNKEKPTYEYWGKEVESVENMKDYYKAEIEEILKLIEKEVKT